MNFTPASEKIGSGFSRACVRKSIALLRSDGSFDASFAMFLKMAVTSSGSLTAAVTHCPNILASIAALFLLASPVNFPSPNEFASLVTSPTILLDAMSSALSISSKFSEPLKTLTASPPLAATISPTSSEPLRTRSEISSSFPVMAAPFLSKPTTPIRSNAILPISSGPGLSMSIATRSGCSPSDTL